MLRSLIFLLGALISVIEAVTFTSPSPVNISLGDNATFTIIASNLSADDKLNWMVGDMKVANLSLNGGSLQLDGGKTINDSIYEVTTSDKETSLTLISPGLSLNGSEVKLTDGTTDSDIATLTITVVCGSPADGATASCFKVGCEATGMINDTMTDKKYKMCNNTYLCSGEGAWNLSNSACTELICNESGKWGENCTDNCGAGCPKMTCFANGSCADASYMNIEPCTGYSGDKCDQEVTTAPSGGSDSTPVTPAVSTSESETTSSSGAGPTADPGSIGTPQSTTESISATTMSPLPDCTEPPSESCTVGENMTKDCERIPGKIETCQWTCGGDETWKNVTSECPYYCRGDVTWGPKCGRACGSGCRESWNGTIRCNATTGRCVDPITGKEKGECLDGYNGDNCQDPICDQDCQGGTCLAKNFCGNCPKDFEHGRTCRNIRLDGLLKGSFPALAILAFVVILLTVSSKLYIRRKIKDA